MEEKNPIKTMEMFNTLSDREFQIVEMVMSGQSNKEIANNLGLDEGTIKQHVFRICNKLGVRKRTQFLPMFINAMTVEIDGEPDFSGKAISPEFAYEMGFNRFKTIVHKIILGEKIYES